MYKILLTGASGYIGSCLHQSLKSKYKFFLLDKKKSNSLKIIICDLNNKKKLDQIFKKKKPDLVIHLAAQSLVDEQINKKKYISNNITATKNLVEVMKINSINNIIFSSTAAVYLNKSTKINEIDWIKPKSQYAKSKLKCEEIINKSGLNAVILRFFNVCSAITKPKIIGELHNPETHLIPTLVYKNKLRKKILIYGNNFNTLDGTCVRDYIHVQDICMAINKSISYLKKNNNVLTTLNIGGENKLTNLEVLKEINKITHIKSIYNIIKARKGDVSSLTCSIQKAKKIIKWQPRFSSIKKIIKDEIKWVDYLIANKKKRTFKNYNK